LEDVLGVLLGQAEPAAADRVDVAREALHELVPRGGIARAAPRNELRIGLLDGHGLGRYDFAGKRSAEEPVERRYEQLDMLVAEHERRPDLEHVVALAGEPDEDPVLAQLVDDVCGDLVTRQLNSGEETGATHLEDV